MLLTHRCNHRPGTHGRCLNQLRCVHSEAYRAEQMIKIIETLFPLIPAFHRSFTQSFRYLYIFHDIDFFFLLTKETLKLETDPANKTDSYLSAYMILSHRGNILDSFIS